MNITEAFKALNALDEDTFTLSDDGITKLADFQDNDDLADELDIIDVEAETEDDLQDSYVGKVILDCEVCHSKLYKDKEEVELNEDQTLANVGEECPYCYTSEGFKVIGEVAALSTDDTEGTEEVEVEDNTQDTEVIEEALNLDSEGKALKRAISRLVLDSDEELLDFVKAVTQEVIDERNGIEESYKDVDGIMGGAKGDIYTDTDLKRYWDSNHEDDPILAEYDNYDSWFKDTTVGMQKMNEDVNNVNVETDNGVVNVSAEGDTVTVTTEPISSGGATDVDGATEDEVIVPVTDETESEIVDGASDMGDEFVDMDVEGFDEETFDELGESYLKTVYENIQSYKTSKVLPHDFGVIVEGVITFKSGNAKKTSFLFEAKDANKSGRVRFVGENLELTKGKKAFTLKGNVSNGKFITESFRYNYRTKDSTGKSNRVFGTLNRKG